MLCASTRRPALNTHHTGEWGIIPEAIESPARRTSIDNERVQALSGRGELLVGARRLHQHGIYFDVTSLKSRATTKTLLSCSIETERWDAS